MPIPDTNGLPPFADFAMVVAKLNELVAKYNNLLVNLDTLNIVELNAKVITGESITGDKLQANTITGDKIKANTISADKLDVNELSAITANLGTIISGIIYGAFFATSPSGYPRIEISGENKYIKLFLTETTYIEIVHSGEEGYPKIKYVRGSESFYIGYGALIDYPGISSSSPFSIFAWGGLYLTGANIFYDWSMLINNTTSRTLQDELDDINSTLTTLTNAISTLTADKADKDASTSTAGAHNHGIPDGTVLVTDSGTVTWSVNNGHSHTQT